MYCMYVLYFWNKSSWIWKMDIQLAYLVFVLLLPIYIGEWKLLWCVKHQVVRDSYAAGNGKSVKWRQNKLHAGSNLATYSKTVKCIGHISCEVLKVKQWDYLLYSWTNKSLIISPFPDCIQKWLVQGMIY